MKFPGLLLFWLLTVLGLSVGAAAVANGGVPPDTASLRRRIGAAGLDDSTKVRLLAELCYSLRETQPERALAYGEAAVVRARNLPEPGQAPLLLKALLNLATSYANLSNGPQALVLLNEAEELARSTANNDALTRTYAAQGSIYHERADSTTAWRHYQRALKLAQQEDVTPRTRMKLYGNVGSLFSFRQEYARALHFDSLALGLARRWRDSTAEANYLSSLATFQMHNGNLPRAKRLLTQALAISRRQNAVRNQANQLILFALYYLKNGEPERAESATREGLRLARQSGYLERVLDAGVQGR
jgi:Tfp pilus assembly protein PilF